jgi:hypothetical protein
MVPLVIDVGIKKFIFELALALNGLGKVIVAGLPIDAV